MPIRVLLADDHAVVRNGLREFLEDEPDLAVVGQVATGQDAIDRALTLQPDVVVMDIAMPGLSGVEATRRLRELAPTIRILALSAYDDAPYVLAMINAGAAGYVLKTSESGEIVRAVRAVAAGSVALDPAVAGLLVARVAGGTAHDAALSEREREVLCLAARGLTNKQIGAALAISDRTVQNHLANIYGKLQVASRTEAVTTAIQRGLIDMSPVRRADGL